MTGKNSSHSHPRQPELEFVYHAGVPTAWRAGSGGLRTKATNLAVLTMAS